MNKNNSEHIVPNVQYTDGQNAAFLKELMESGVSFGLSRYQNWIADTIRENRADPVFQKELLPIIQSERPYQDSVFLSVVMRTQGRRPEALREALLSLYAQSCQDFEVVLIAHKPSQEQLAMVEEILDELVPEFRSKVRFFVLDHGQRSMPLNVGFAHARGRYVGILDDDDIVLEDWVLEYEKAARENPGKVLHTYVFGQKWKVLKAPDGEEALQACGAPLPEFCKDFHLEPQLTLNVCPTNSLAFPRQAFWDCGITFDDSLTTTEDWDFLMRTVFLFGIVNIPEANSIYRLWTNTENSQSVHNQAEWRRNYNRILKKYKKSFLLMEPEETAYTIDRNNPTLADTEEAEQEEITEESLSLPEVLNSASWKIGRMITFLPRQIRAFRKELRRNGWKSAVKRFGSKLKSIRKIFINYFG